MTSKLEKIIILLKKECSISLHTMFTTKTGKCIFLLGMDKSGNILSINIKHYDIYAQENEVPPFLRRIFISLLDMDENRMLESSRKYYDQFISFFPRYMGKVVVHVDNHFILNNNNIYKIVEGNILNKKILFLPKFDVEFLYENKWSFSVEILSFNNDIFRKVEYLATNDIFDHLPSDKISSDFCDDSFEKIKENQKEVDSIKNIFLTTNELEKKIKNEIKDLEDYYGNTNTYETKLKIQEKIKKKNKLKNIETIRKDCISNLYEEYLRTLHLMTVFIHGKSYLDKKYIEMESFLIDFSNKMAI